MTNLTRLLVAVESPYAAPTPEGIERNILYARRALADSIQRGEAPFASHLLYTQPGVLDDNVEEARAMGIDCGLCWTQEADFTAFYLDYGMSKGMLAAEEAAKSAGLHVANRFIGKNADDN